MGGRDLLGRHAANKHPPTRIASPIITDVDIILPPRKQMNHIFRNPKV
jgi:hypothetical protein